MIRIQNECWWPSRTKRTHSGIFAGLPNAEMPREVQHKYCVADNVCTGASERAVFREDGSRLLSEVHIDRRRGNGRKMQQKKLKLNIGRKTAQQLS